LFGAGLILGIPFTIIENAGAIVGKFIVRGGENE
jgi:hypothetical protein